MCYLTFHLIRVLLCKKSLPLKGKAFLVCAQIFSFAQDWRDVEGAIPYDVCAKILILHELSITPCLPLGGRWIFATQKDGGRARKDKFCEKMSGDS